MISYPGFGENISDELKKKKFVTGHKKARNTLHMSDNVLEKRVLSLRKQVALQQNLQ